QSGPKATEIKIQLLDTINDQWLEFKDLSYPGAGSDEEYIYNDEILKEGKYYFRAKIGAGGFDYYDTLNVVDCSDCEESFTYVTNNDGTYTFTYVPAEDMDDASIVFTFAQGVV